MCWTEKPPLQSTNTEVLNHLLGIFLLHNGVPFVTAVIIIFFFSLHQCKLKESCCTDLASVLNSGMSQLKLLDLSYNTLKDSGVSELTAGLSSPNSSLETLRSVKTSEKGHDCASRAFKEYW